MGVDLVGVSKSYGRPILRDLHLSVAPGEIFALLGPSGCGKTTALRIVAGLETPDAGEVRVDGRLVAAPGHALPPEARGLGMVFQSYAVWPHMTVLDNVRWPLTLRGLADATERARDALARVRLAGLEDRWPSTLSGGQQQRVAIARALVTTPSLLLADEPTGNLDTESSRDIMGILDRLNREEGITVILVTHEPDIAAYAAREIVIKDGQVLTDRQTRPEHPSFAVGR